MQNSLITQEQQDALNAIREHAKRIKKRTTPKNVIYQRKGPKDKITGENIMLSYIKQGYMSNVLDNEYPGWSWEVQRIEQFGATCSVTGTLTVFDNGMIRRISGVGNHPISLDAANLDYTKSAETDAFKRACSRLGIGFDIYSGENPDAADKEKPMPSMKALDGFWKHVVDKLRIHCISNEVTGNPIVDNFNYKLLAKLIHSYTFGDITVEQIKEGYKDLL